MSAEPERSEPQDAAPRTGSGRHAARRTRGRHRARLLAMAAVPTALLMGTTIVPELAHAAVAGNTNCTPAPTTVTPVPKSQLTPVPGPTKAAAQEAGKAVPATFTAPQPPAGASQQQAARAVTSGVVQQAAAVQPGQVQSQDLIGTILGGIAGIFDPHHQNQSTPTPSPSPSSAAPGNAAPRVGAPVTPSTPAEGGAPAAPAPGAATPGTPGPSVAPSASPSGSASPSASAAASGSASASASAPASTSASPSMPVSPSAVASALANGDTRPLCPVDTTNLSAAGTLTGNVVPDQSWTLHTTKLSLYGAVFGGVYEVHSPTRTYRVLKFTVSSVDIDNLDMSTIENTAIGSKPAETFHVKGGPNTTSTMRNGPIVMYVESLSGELASLYGIPLPPLGTITLTPDTLPEWLYNLIGAIPIPIDMALTGVKAVQAGQFGGDLHIPGMQLYNDTQPYDGL
ncbi:hypothetical protein [Kitasatospora viridis]|uniref:Uncharacterized protein n=1 Tax=Kitasatospora viridis TaxID=281105 RepID=A0A561UES6_9ACTN|nr:hypothetical protein [Kitasatospora viridis]TWF97862.1 hypothetical protein FHX73_111663 [Kitasatospora viridis]